LVEILFFLAFIHKKKKKLTKSKPISIGQFYFTVDLFMPRFTKKLVDDNYFLEKDQERLRLSVSVIEAIELPRRDVLTKLNPVKPKNHSKLFSVLYLLFRINQNQLL
jgi:hypothetical protein